MEQFSTLDEILGTDINWKEEFVKYEVHPDDVIEKEQACVKIHGGERDIDVCTIGNFSAIVGFMKARKSFVMSMFLSAFVRGGLLYNKFMTDIKDGVAVLIDTEQGIYHLQHKLKAIEQMANGFDNVRSYALRRLNPKQRIEFIDSWLQEYGHEVQFVVIDGIADLVWDINDIKESEFVSQKLMTWTVDYDIHIMCIIHQNKADRYARGHIGTKIMQKAESVIHVEKDGAQSKVVCEYSRSEPFEPFRMGIDMYGIPYVSEDTVSAIEENF